MDNFDKNFKIMSFVVWGFLAIISIIIFASFVMLGIFAYNVIAFPADTASTMGGFIANFLTPIVDSFE